MTEAQFELMLGAFREQHNELRAIHEAALGKLRGISYYHPRHQPGHPRRARRAGLAGVARCPLVVTASGAVGLFRQLYLFCAVRVMRTR